MMDLGDEQDPLPQTGVGLVDERNEMTSSGSLFRTLQEVSRRPNPFEVCTTRELWTDEYTSTRMLEYHLNPDVDLASRKAYFIDRSAAWIISHFGLCAGKAVADFGCGPGLYTSRLAVSKASVTGIDFSENSLRYARKTALSEGLAINYVPANYLEYSSNERFDLITMIMCDYCALSPLQRQTLLGVFAAHLRAGGAVLLDVCSKSAFEAREEGAICGANLLDGFWSPRPYYGFLNVFKYPAEMVVVDKYTVVEETRTRVIYNWLQYFDLEMLSREFEAAGFEIETYLGDVSGAAFDPTSHEFAVVARRRRQG